jgi:hypothetical protein
MSKLTAAELRIWADGVEKMHIKDLTRDLRGYADEMERNQRQLAKVNAQLRHACRMIAKAENDDPPPCLEECTPEQVAKTQGWKCFEKKEAKP